MLSPIEIARRQLTITTHRIHTLPVLVLMPHSRCNCRCVMCDIWKANRNGIEISRETLEQHVGAIRGLNVQWVVLSGGEALMHSNLWSLCELLREQGVRITLLSTGLLLRRNAADVRKWVDEVIISLDGGREIHDSIRNIPRAYEQLADGVTALREIDPDFRVTGRCVIQRRNYFDLPNIIDAAREIGLDQISFLAVDVSTSAFNRAIPWGEERIDDTALSPDEVAHFNQVLEQTIERYADDFQSGLIAESPDKLRRLVQYFSALNRVGDFPTTTCNAPWVSAVVEPNGDVKPCYFHEPYGNIYANSLDEILNSPEAVTFRRNLDVTANPICRKCVCTLHLGRRTRVGERG
jgi:Fe-coproporphyrin III synthase